MNQLALCILTCYVMYKLKPVRPWTRLDTVSAVAAVIVCYMLFYR
jgi:hypothetical protein